MVRWLLRAWALHGGHQDGLWAMARGRIGTGITVAVLGAAGGVVLLALWAPLVLAAWIADLVHPLVPSGLC